MELARCANVQIQGMSDELMRMVRAQSITCEAPKYHAALGMLASINELSDDIFTLLFGDPGDEFTREEANRIMRKLGLESIDAGAYEEDDASAATEVSHG